MPLPSLGAPLLSASWSPPLPCGMGLDINYGIDGGVDGIIGGGVDGIICGAA